jgi:ABC-2 type transport system permease protein
MSVAKNTRRSPAFALWSLGLKQNLKGAIIMGVLIGCMLAIQGVGYAATYPTDADRQAFAATLGNAPSLGILYGEPIGMQSAIGYMVYRGAAVMALFGSIWALLATTKMLRGAEEDGRWESILAGVTTRRRAVLQTISGMMAALLVGFILSTLVTLSVAAYPDIDLSVTQALEINIAVFLPILFFIGVGAVTSQLAVTRRRAVMYGIAPLLAFFSLRSIGNILSDWYWLKNLTPFGWSDQLHPIVGFVPMWIIPLALVPLLLIGLGVYLAGKRDLGESLVRESDHARPRYYLLKSAWQLAFRLNLGVFAGWCVGLMAMSGIFASVASLAADAVAESPALSQSIVQLTGGDDSKIQIAFLGAFAIFIAAGLMVMVTMALGSIRRDEAKLYAETILVQPVSRVRWLVGRLAIIVGTTTFACLLPNIVVYFVGRSQGVELDGFELIVGNLQMLGATAFLVGIGTLIYGIFPRLATINMYLIILWSFSIDLIGAVVDFGDVIKQSSLFHYISLVPITNPDWTSFAWLCAIGLGASTVGVWLFTKRDITNE